MRDLEDGSENAFELLPFLSAENGFDQVERVDNHGGYQSRNAAKQKHSGIVIFKLKCTS